MGGQAPGPAGCGRHGGLIPVIELHREVAVIALRAAARHGFALGGGNALMAHGVIDQGSPPMSTCSPTGRLAWWRQPMR